MPTLPREAQPSTEETPFAPGLPVDQAILTVRGVASAGRTNALGTRAPEARSRQAERPR